MNGCGLGVWMFFWNVDLRVGYILRGFWVFEFSVFS